GGGQPVVVGEGRYRLDGDVQVDVEHHAADEHELLRVLLAEDGEVRADTVEQLQHHAQHAIEEAGPEFALEDRAHRAGTDRDLRLGAPVGPGPGGDERRGDPPAAPPA